MRVCDTALPFKVSAPVPGRDVMLMLLRLSPSTSAKLKSLSAKVLVAFSLMVTVLFAAVGKSFAGVTSIVIV